MKKIKILVVLAGVVGMSVTSNVMANCASLPNHAALKTALQAAVAPSNGVPDFTNGGFDLNMWGTLLDRNGFVCNIAFTGNDKGDQWPGSRVISAQKANTANAFSLPGLALSTANLFTAVQPGNSLFGLQESNPVDTNVAYGKKFFDGPSSTNNYGLPNDPMVGDLITGHPS